MSEDSPRPEAATSAPQIGALNHLPSPEPRRTLWKTLGAWYPETPGWKLSFWLVAVILAGTAVYGLSRQGVLPDFFQALIDNLPLTLPILTLALSLALTPQQLKSLDGWLKLPGTLSLGVVNFGVWYVVAAQTSEPWVRVSSLKLINKEYAFVFLLVSFCWAGFCSVFLALAEQEKKKNVNWIILQVVVLSLSIAFLFSPFFLLQTKANIEQRTGVSLDMRRFSVSLAYRDPLMNHELSKRFDQLIQCAVFKGIAAKSPSEAIAVATSQFKSSPRNFQRSIKAHARDDESKEPVEIVEGWTTVQEER